MAKYIREHYKNNKQYYIDRADARKKKLLDLIRSYKQKPCVDCGIQYPPYVMQYDHVSDEDKLFDLGKAHKKGYSEKRILDEIAKCEVVCANCHAERTYQRYTAVV